MAMISPSSADQDARPGWVGFGQWIPYNIKPMQPANHSIWLCIEG